jgi:hypothetical protein
LITKDVSKQNGHRSRSIVVFFCIFALVLAVGYSLWHLAGRSPGRRYGWRSLWRLACLIGTARIAALWLGAAAYRNPGWPQGFGYFLQMLALPEIYLARSMRGDPLKWIMVGSTLLAATSIFWAVLLVWVADRTGHENP